jgi:hypothetical protein
VHEVWLRGNALKETLALFLLINMVDVISEIVEDLEDIEARMDGAVSFIDKAIKAIKAKAGRKALDYLESAKQELTFVDDEDDIELELDDK